MRGYWGIHAGANGEAVDLFLNNHVVALGWPLLGDLSGIDSREELIEWFTSIYKSHPIFGYYRTAAAACGILDHFLHDVKKGDIFVFYFGTQYKYYFGEITGKYFFDFTNSDFPHQIPVKWITNVLKSDTSHKFRNSMGSGVPLFNLSKYKEEIESYIIPG